MLTFLIETPKQRTWGYWLGAAFLAIFGTICGYDLWLVLHGQPSITDDVRAQVVAHPILIAGILIVFAVVAWLTRYDSPWLPMLAGLIAAHLGLFQ